MNFEEDFEDDEEKVDMHEADDSHVSFGTCLVCQEDLNNSKGFGALGFIQPSRLLRKHPDGQISHVNEALTAPESLDRPAPSRIGTHFPPKDAEAMTHKNERMARCSTVFRPITPNSALSARHARI